MNRNSDVSMTRALGRRTAQIVLVGALAAAPLALTAGVANANTDWDALAQCESGGDWSINTGNGYYGGLQFSQSTWNAFGGSGSAHNASKSEQIRVAENVKAGQGMGAWPTCSKKTGQTSNAPSSSSSESSSESSSSESSSSGSSGSSSSSTESASPAGSSATTSGSSHTVQSGDTLSAIASAAGTSVGEVVANNPGLSDPDRISVGQVISL